MNTLYDVPSDASAHDLRVWLEELREQPQTKAVKAAIRNVTKQLTAKRDKPRKHAKNDYYELVA